MTPTFKEIETVVGKVKNLQSWYDAMVELAPKYDINTKERWAGFVAQITHESGHFKYTVENLNYSATALNKVFSKYFKKAGRDAKAYARKPEAIANVVYANRMGNGDTASGDGWKFRGRGVIQLTGKNNHSAFAKTRGTTASKNLEYLGTVAGSIESAMWFWKTNNLNSYCDAKDIKGMSKRINGGYNGLDDRTKLWDKGMSTFKKSNPVFEKPVKAVTPPKVDKPKKISQSRPLGIGDRGDDVAALQKSLNIVADGIFGPNTQRAVKAYQRSKGLIPDGVVGPFTFKRITGN